VGCFCCVLCDPAASSRSQGRASCMRSQQVYDAATSNGRRAARFSDCETTGDDDEEEDDENDDENEEYSTSSSDTWPEDELDMHRRARRSPGKQLVKVIWRRPHRICRKIVTSLLCFLGPQELPLSTGPRSVQSCLHSEAT